MTRNMLSLIEKAQESFDDAAAAKLEKKARNATFDLEDYLEQMQQMKKMGSMKDMLNMLPGMAGKLKDVEIDESALKKPEAIIRSMTLKERRNPDILNASRRRRIAAGAGVTVQDVNQLVRQFEQAKQMMKQMMGSNKFLRRRMKFGR